MNKILKMILSILVILIIAILGFGIYKFNFTNDDIYLKNGSQINTYDGIYKIDGQDVELKNGISTKDVENSTSKVITKVFGNEVKKDFDNDGNQDLAFLITQETGGTGVFYYIVARLNTKNGPVGTEGFFIGDRIAPQTTEIRQDNIILVNYADRGINEDFSIKPSIGVSKYLRLDLDLMRFISGK